MSDVCVCKQWLRARELGIQVGQDLEELLQFYNFLGTSCSADHLRSAGSRCPRRPLHVLEIGTQHGGWLFMLASVIRPPARFCAVDMFYCCEFDIARREVETMGFEVEFLRMDDADALGLVTHWLGGERLDVLHLDAHHNQGVREEWNLFSPLVRPGGIIVIHDVRPTGPHAQFGAQELFEDMVDSRLETHLCLKTWREGLGIGVVRIPEETIRQAADERR